jgi:hypothetical protein
VRENRHTETERRHGSDALAGVVSVVFWSKVAAHARGCVESNEAPELMRVITVMRAFITRALLPKQYL